MNRLRLRFAIVSVVSISFAALEIIPPKIASAGIVPAGSRVFMTVSGPTGACPNGGLCALTAGPMVPQIFPTTTFTDPRGPSFGTLTSSEDVMTAKTMHGTINANTTDFQYLAISDTYTVHGSASGSFPITVSFHITGTFGSIPHPSLGNIMGLVSSQLEIGTFHPEATLTQFVIDPFPADALNPKLAQVSQSQSGPGPSAVPFSFPWDLQVSYTKMVSVNDVFDMAYGLDMNTSGNAQMDLNPGGLDVISFALPTGIYLTSALGATFGTQPTLGGDYNQNGVVDAADYTVWRDNLGAPAGTLPNDTDGGPIGPPQYSTWKTNFGQVLGSGAWAHTAVPEPSSLPLLILAAVTWRLRHPVRHRVHEQLVST